MTKEEWVRKLEEASEKSIRWYPPWNEREQIIIKCEGYPNVPLLGTQGTINYNPELTVRQAGYPIITPPTEEALTPFVLPGLEALKGVHYRKIWHAWSSPTKNGVTKKLRSCGASPETIRLPWNKIQPRDSSTQQYEVQETLEVERLKESLDKTKAEKAHWKRKLEEALDEVYHEKHVNDEITKKAKVEHEARLRISSCLKAADKEIHMEQAIDELEQQSMQTRAEVGQIREHMGEMREQLNKVFELLTRNTSLPAPTTTLGVAFNAATQGTPAYPPGFSSQYGMPLGWNAPAEAQVVEEPEAVEASRLIPQATQATVSFPHYFYPPGPLGQTGATFKNLEATPVHDKKISSLKQWVRIIEGTGGHGLDATDLCLMSDVALPVDFKTPKFEKYKGSSCPRVHLAMYCRKMAAYIHQDKILVHCFQDSLTRGALNWYVNLEKGQVKTWRDLAEAFVRQYRYNEDMASNRSRLQNLSKMESEGFKDYAQRWHELAAQVKPPLTEKEMVSMFIETLSSPFYDKAVGSMASNFADLVTVGERIEFGLKRGRIASNSTSSIRKPIPDRRKGETNPVTIDPSKPYGPGGNSSSPPVTLNPPGMVVSTNPPNANRGKTANPTNAQNPRTSRFRRTFTPIPMTYTTLFHQLLQKRMITTAPPKPLEPPYPRSYDSNAKCEYHEGGPGHTTKNCWALKHRIQDLLEGGWLNLK
ncbi:hypothetical protein CR513_33322, partial [Mucuna pruriens]